VVAGWYLTNQILDPRRLGAGEGAVPSAGRWCCASSKWALRVKQTSAGMVKCEAILSGNLA